MHALEALRDPSSPRALVVRNGEQQRFAEFPGLLRRKKFFDRFRLDRATDFLVSDNEIGYLTTFEQSLKLAIRKAFGRLSGDKILRDEYQPHGSDKIQD